MAKRTKKNETDRNSEELNINAHILGAGEVVEQHITDTLEVNYMPYAMSVIMSRAIPEIDGFKPSHRKLLYTMYKMGLLQGGTIKSANIVGRTMQLNPHGDAAIYETMIRLARGNESLLHPYVESKGNFGKSYSKNMQYAASRYTEAKLAPISAELFRDIDKDTVDFVPNYYKTQTEPTLLHVKFTSVLVNSNIGKAGYSRRYGFKYLFVQLERNLRYYRGAYKGPRRRYNRNAKGSRFYRRRSDTLR